MTATVTPINVQNAMQNESQAMNESHETAPVEKIDRDVLAKALDDCLGNLRTINNGKIGAIVIVLEQDGAATVASAGIPAQLVPQLLNHLAETPMATPPSTLSEEVSER